MDRTAQLTARRTGLRTPVTHLGDTLIDVRPTVRSTVRSTARIRSALALASARCTRGARVLDGQLDGRLDGALAQSVSAPVVLGLGVHRDRTAPRLAAAGADGAGDAARRRSGATGGSRTSSSTPPCRSTRTSRAPTSGAPRPRGAPRAPRAPYRPPASCSHRCTRSRPGWCTAPTRVCPGRAASSPGCIPGSPPGTAICCTAATWAAAAWRPSCTPGSRAWTTAPAGTRPLARVTPAPARSFRRADLDHGAAEDRPTDLDYGRYVRLGDATTGTRGYADGARATSRSRTPRSTPCSSPPSTRWPTSPGSWAATGTARHARAERLTAALVRAAVGPGGAGHVPAAGTYAAGAPTPPVAPASAACYAALTGLAARSHRSSRPPP